MLVLFEKVVIASKMDVWCDIREDKNGNIYVFDLENKRRISFKYAVKLVYEGVCDLQSLGFTQEEEDVFNTYCYMIVKGERKI